VRYDAAQLRYEPELTPEGFLVVEIIFARPGVYEYEQADGTIRRELVPEEELHDAESLATMRYKCVTSEHPEDDVNSTNVRELSVGDVPEAPQVIEGGLVSVKAVVKDAESVSEIRTKKRDKSSPGYTLTTLEEKPGVHPEHGPYDAIQRGRRYNHLALTDAPRGGDGMRVRMDSAAQRRTDSMFTPAPKEPPTNEDEMDPEELKKIIAAAIAEAVKPVTDRLDTLEEKLTKTDEDDPTPSPKPKEKADEDEPEMDKADTDDPEKPAAMNHDSRVAWFTERSKLQHAAQAAGLEGELEKLTNAQLKKKIVLHVRKDAKQDGSAEYYSAAFDMLDLDRADSTSGGSFSNPWDGAFGGGNHHDGGNGGHRHDGGRGKEPELAEDVFFRNLQNTKASA
jgi:hypothetical protein